MNQLLEKYNVPVPRYTSYPTVPFWNEQINVEQWKEEFAIRFEQENPVKGISLYIHLPFCEQLCTYCGCNKKITKNHSVEEGYIDLLLKEWSLYKTLMNAKPLLRELHLGGGTPTFFSPQNLQKFLSNLLADCNIHPDHAFSFEGHPNNTTKEHLQTLFHLGFRRVSFGVQDNDAEVQRIINRIQPLENVERVTIWAREIGYTSVNFDLIYGLPKQTLTGIEKTIRECIGLRPDRIAFYSYAHVPWTSRGQRLFDENDLPDAATKISLYKKGKELLVEAGYVDVGMDHFALPTDELIIAHSAGKLHRNFMGYTTQETSILLGLGVSSISDTGTGFAQNEKTIHNYSAKIMAGEFPVVKGYFLNDEDVAFRKYILDISCRGKTKFQPQHLPTFKEFSFPVLENLAADGLVHFDETGLEITTLGKHFIRNICSAFDLKLQQQKDGAQRFSKAV